MSHKYHPHQDLPSYDPNRYQPSTTVPTSEYSSFDNSEQQKEIARGLSFDSSKQPAIGFFSAHSFDTASDGRRRLFEKKSIYGVGHRRVGSSGSCSNSIFRRLAATESESSENFNSSTFIRQSVSESHHPYPIQEIKENRMTSLESTSHMTLGGGSQSFQEFDIVSSSSAPFKVQQPPTEESYDSPTASPAPPQCNRRPRHSSSFLQEETKKQTAREDTEEALPEFQVSTIPCRNLTDAFEQMASSSESQSDPVEERDASDDGPSSAFTKVDSTNTPKQNDVETEKEDVKGGISPAGVADLDVESQPGKTREDEKAPVSHDDSQHPSSTPPATPKTLSPESPPYRWDGSDTYHKMELPTFNLYSALQRNLSQPTVNRVSFYGVIHDINKEANGMAANDPCAMKEEKEEKQEQSKEEESCPLVIAVNGPPQQEKHEEEKSDKPLSTMVNSAIIDEEKWLLSAIASRSPEEISQRKTCGSSLAEAMGEQEPAGEHTQQNGSRNAVTANPLSELASSRTQLWKPSRSWWEAKSGKNPWIEPLSHNKRWRFLWPLIHYHKFLARCIKKLKRNGVDVKSSVSPVPVFLREEVCAVSDHLAEMSKFTSEEWMSALVHFHGWTDPDPQKEEELRALVSRQKLRSLVEPSDVQSPLLRDQIDEQFLRAMASARDQMVNGAFQQGGGRGGGPGNGMFPQGGNMKQGRGYGHPQYAGYYGHNMGPPYGGRHHPPLPSQGGTRNRGNRNQMGKRNKSRNQFERYTNNGRGYGWNHPPPYGGGSKSYGMYPPHYGHAHAGHGMHGDGHHGHYYPSMHHPHHHYPGGHINYYHGHDNGYAPHGYHPDYSGTGYPHPHNEVGGNHGYGASHQQMPVYPPTPGTPVGPHAVSVPSTPQGVPVAKQQQVSQLSIDASNQNQSEAGGSQKDPADFPPPSPYWGHLDQTTLAMTGLMTPLGKEAPSTPHRQTTRHEQDPAGIAEEGGRQFTFDNNDGGKGNAHAAQPLLINPSAQYYNDHQHGAAGGNVPPSPATQFLMAPQGNWAQTQPHHPAFFGHVPGSPHANEMMGQQIASIPDENAVSNNKGQNTSDGEDTDEEVTPPPVVKKMTSAAESSEEGNSES